MLILIDNVGLLSLSPFNLIYHDLLSLFLSKISTLFNFFQIPQDVRSSVDSILNHVRTESDDEFEAEVAEILRDSPFEGLDMSDFPNTTWSFSSRDLDEIFSDPFLTIPSLDLDAEGKLSFIYSFNLRKYLPKKWFCCCLKFSVKF